MKYFWNFTFLIFLATLSLGAQAQDSNPSLGYQPSTPGIVQKLSESDVQKLVDQMLSDSNFKKELQQAAWVSDQKKRSCGNGSQTYRWEGLYRKIYARLAGPFEVIQSTNNTIFSDNNTPLEPYATRETLSFLEELGRTNRLISRQPLVINHLTSAPEKLSDAHCTHRGGLAIDIRLLGGHGDISWRNRSIYNRKMNRDLIAKLVVDPRVEYVYFNDPQILNDKEIKAHVQARSSSDRPVTLRSISGHDDHIHVSLYPDVILEQLTNEIFSRF